MYKARIFLRGYQSATISSAAYARIFEITTALFVTSLAISTGWVVHELEVKKELLISSLGDEYVIYVHPPDGIEIKITDGSKFELKNVL